MANFTDDIKMIVNACVSIVTTVFTLILHTLQFINRMMFKVFASIYVYVIGIFVILSAMSIILTLMMAISPYYNAVLQITKTSSSAMHLSYDQPPISWAVLVTQHAFPHAKALQSSPTTHTTRATQKLSGGRSTNIYQVEPADNMLQVFFSYVVASITWLFPFVVISLIMYCLKRRYSPMSTMPTNAIMPLMTSTVSSSSSNSPMITTTTTTATPNPLFSLTPAPVTSVTSVPSPISIPSTTSSVDGRISKSIEAMGSNFGQMVDILKDVKDQLTTLNKQPAQPQRRVTLIGNGSRSPVAMSSSIPAPVWHNVHPGTSIFALTPQP